MTNLTPSSWVKIVLITLLCLVLCAGVGGCMVGISSSVRTALGLFGSHHRMAENAEFQNIGQAEVAAESVRDLEIAWLAGSVEVQAIDDELANGMIQVQEFAYHDSASISERDRMRWSLTGEQLSIAYDGGRSFDLGDLVNWDSRSAKRLVVSIPRSHAQNLRTVGISGASGHYSLAGIGCDKLSVDLASGELNATTEVRANELELDMASGNVNIEGVFPDAINVDMASGNTSIICLEQCPAAVDISSMSGNTKVYVPKGSDYTVNYDKVSGSIDCPGTTAQGDSYVAGDGSASFSVCITSGKVLIAQSSGLAVDDSTESAVSAAPSAPKAPAAPEAPAALSAS